MCVRAYGRQVSVVDVRVFRACARGERLLGVTNIIFFFVGSGVAVRVLAHPPHEVLKSALSIQLEALLLDQTDFLVLLAPLALPAGAGVAEKMYL